MPRSSSADPVERIVINSGPLIALARAKRLNLIERLPLEFVCPLQVREELDHGAALGHPRVESSALGVLSLSTPLTGVATSALDEGEAAVIQLALERNIARVCIDEVRGRRAAVAAGLEVSGTLGLLLRAKRLDLIPAIRPILRELSQQGIWYRAELVQRVIDAAGE